MYRKYLHEDNFRNFFLKNETKKKRLDMSEADNSAFRFFM